MHQNLCFTKRVSACYPFTDSRQGSAARKLSRPSFPNSSSKNIPESKQFHSSKSNITGSSRPQKVYSSSKFNDTRTSTKARTDNKEQFRSAVVERRRSHPKTPLVPLIVCDEFQEDIISDNVQGAEESGKLLNDTHLDEYRTFASNFHWSNDEPNIGEVPLRASSTKSSSRYRRQETENRRESCKGSVSHWGSFELSSDEENYEKYRPSSAFNVVGDFPRHISPAQSNSYVQAQQLTDPPRSLSTSQFFPSGKEIGEAVEDADFESDDDRNQEASGKICIMLRVFWQNIVF